MSNSFNSTEGIREHQRLQQLKALFLRRDETYLKEDLASVAEYFSYLSSSIDSSKLQINANADLIKMFEAVYLWLQDKLLLYPDSIKSQISQIEKAGDLCQTFAIFSGVDEKFLQQARRNSVYGFLSGARISLLGLGISGIQEDDYLNTSKMLAARVALNRLSQVVFYATSIQPLGHDKSVSDFKGSYDSEQIDKNKIIALINFMRVQAKDIPESIEKQKLLSKLDELETELRRPGPRWGVIITGFFVLFGFLADMKAVSPGTYDQLHDIAQRIVSIIHEDGQVQQQKRFLLSPSSNAIEAGKVYEEKDSQINKTETKTD